MPTASCDGLNDVDGASIFFHRSHNRSVIAKAALAELLGGSWLGRDPAAQMPARQQARNFPLARSCALGQGYLALVQSVVRSSVLPGDPAKSAWRPQRGHEA